MKLIFDEIKLNNELIDESISDDEIECTININIDKLPLEVKINYIKYSHACREGAKVYLELFKKDVINYIKEAFKVDAGITKIRVILSKDSDNITYVNSNVEKDQLTDVTQSITEDTAEELEDKIEDDFKEEKDGGNE